MHIAPSSIQFSWFQKKSQLHNSVKIILSLTVSPKECSERRKIQDGNCYAVEYAGSIVSLQEKRNICSSLSSSPLLFDLQWHSWRHIESRAFLTRRLYSQKPRVAKMFNRKWQILFNEDKCVFPPYWEREKSVKMLVSPIMSWFTREHVLKFDSLSRLLVQFSSQPHLLGLLIPETALQTPTRISLAGFVENFVRDEGL